MGTKLFDEDYIAELEELVGIKQSTLPRPVGIGKTPWKLAGLLATHNFVTYEFAFRAIYGAIAEADQPEYCNDCIRISKSRLGVVLAKHKIEIKTNRGVGVYIEKAVDRERLKKLIWNESPAPKPNPARADVSFRGFTLKVVGNDRVFGGTGWSSVVAVPNAPSEPHRHRASKPAR